MLVRNSGPFPFSPFAGAASMNWSIWICGAVILFSTVYYLSGRNKQHDVSIEYTSRKIAGTEDICIFSLPTQFAGRSLPR